MILDKNAILNSDDIVYETVHMPEWGGDVKIKTMSIAEQIEFEELSSKKTKESDVVFNLIYLSCVDEDGNRLFEEQDDIANLKKKSAPAITRLFQKCIDINLITQKELDTLAKKS